MDKDDLGFFRLIKLSIVIHGIGALFIMVMCLYVTVQFLFEWNTTPNTSAYGAIISILLALGMAGYTGALVIDSIRDFIKFKIGGRNE